MRNETWSRAQCGTLDNTLGGKNHTSAKKYRHRKKKKIGLSLISNSPAKLETYMFEFETRS